jgi:hypothetical protein
MLANLVNYCNVLIKYKYSQKLYFLLICKSLFPNLNYMLLDLQNDKFYKGFRFKSHKICMGMSSLWINIFLEFFANLFLFWKSRVTLKYFFASMKINTNWYLKSESKTEPKTRVLLVNRTQIRTQKFRTQTELKNHAYIIHILSKGFVTNRLSSFWSVTYYIAVSNNSIFKITKSLVKLSRQHGSLVVKSGNSKIMGSNPQAKL